MSSLARRRTASILRRRIESTRKPNLGRQPEAKLSRTGRQHLMVQSHNRTGRTLTRRLIMMSVRMSLWQVETAVNLQPLLRNRVTHPGAMGRLSSNTMSRSLVAGAMRLAMWKWSKDRKVSSILHGVWSGSPISWRSGESGVQGHVRAGPWGVIAVLS